MSAAEASDRQLIARLAAHTKWAIETDRAAATAPARQAQLDRWEREADPDGTLDPAERRRVAASLRRAHMHRLALRSAQARRARRGSAA